MGGARVLHLSFGAAEVQRPLWCDAMLALERPQEGRYSRAITWTDRPLN